MVTKLDRLARSPPEPRATAEELTVRQLRLSLGGAGYDPHDPVGRLLFNVLAIVAELVSDLIRLRAKEGMRMAKAKGRLRGLTDLFGVARSTVYRALQRDQLQGVARRPTTADGASTRQ